MRPPALLPFLLALTLVPVRSTAAPRYSSAFQSHQIPFFGSEVVAADYNRDGRMDLAVVSTGGIVLLQGMPGGTFLRADTLAVTGRSRGAAADLDGDQNPDLALSGGGMTSVLLGNGDLTFQPAVNYDPGGSPAAYGVDLADVDGDDVLDLVSVDSASVVRVCPGDGNGAFGLPIAHLTAANAVNRVAARDLDDDGDADVVVVESGVQLTVFLNQGGGSFAAGVSYPDLYAYGGTLAVGDVNGDGLPEIAAGQQLWRNIGGGAFDSWTVIGPGDGSEADPAFGDFDLDGRLDLVTLVGDATLLGAFHSRRGLGNGTFDAPQKWYTAQSPSGTNVVDMDGDGRLDVVTVGYSFGQVGISRGLGPAGFFAPPSYDAGGDPVDVAIADLDGDTDLDVAAVSHGLLRVFPGNGDATLGAPTDFTTAFNESRVALGDVNADGVADMVTANGTSASISYYRGTGGGAFAPRVDLAVPGSVVDVAIADIGNDGVKDVIALGSGVSVFPGLPGNALGARADYAGLFSPRRLGAALLNGDARTDVAVLDQSGPRFVVFAGNADGTLAAGTPVSLQSDDFYMSMAILDVDDDGDLDLLGATWVSARFVVRLNNGLGTFSTAPTMTSARRLYNVDVTDFDLDGLPDLASANNFAQVASVFRGNGTGGFALECGYGSAGATTDVAAGDLDGDGYPELVTVDAPGMLSLGDGGPGRVTVLQNANSKTVGVPVAADPAQGGLGIVRLWPTVASTSVNVEFTLPARGAVSVELFDLAGRRLLSRALGVLEPGRQTRSLALPRGLPAGLVWLRLRQGGEESAARAVISR